MTLPALSLEAALGACVSALGKVDLLVNCAAWTKRTPTLDLDEEERQRIPGTNLTGTLRACQVFGRHLLERGSGRVVTSLRSRLSWLFSTWRPTTRARPSSPSSRSRSLSNGVPGA